MLGTNFQPQLLISEPRHTFKTSLDQTDTSALFSRV